MSEFKAFRLWHRLARCYCILRMYLEPAVMLELPADDKRFLMCQSFVEMSQGNYHRVRALRNKMK